MVPGLSLGVFSTRGRKGFAWRLLRAGGAGDTARGSGGDRKCLKVPSTVLGVAEGDMLIPAPALVISDGFGFPTLKDARWRVGIIPKLKKSWVLLCIFLQ